MAMKRLAALLKNGADPRKLITGRFGHFLQLAAHNGREDLVELLVANNADVLNNADVNAVGNAAIDFIAVHSVTFHT